MYFVWLYIVACEVAQCSMITLAHDLMKFPRKRASTQQRVRLSPLQQARLCASSMAPWLRPPPS